MELPNIEWFVLDCTSGGLGRDRDFVLGEAKFKRFSLWLFFNEMRRTIQFAKKTKSFGNRKSVESFKMKMIESNIQFLGLVFSQSLFLWFSKIELHLGKILSQHAG